MSNLEITHQVWGEWIRCHLNLTRSPSSRGVERQKRLQDDRIADTGPAAGQIRTRLRSAHMSSFGRYSVANSGGLRGKVGARGP